MKTTLLTLAVLGLTVSAHAAKIVIEVNDNDLERIKSAYALNYHLNPKKETIEQLMQRIFEREMVNAVKSAEMEQKQREFLNSYKEVQFEVKK